MGLFWKPASSVPPRICMDVVLHHKRLAVNFQCTKLKLLASNATRIVIPLESAWRAIQPGNRVWRRAVEATPGGSILSTSSHGGAGDECSAAPTGKR